MDQETGIDNLASALSSALALPYSQCQVLAPPAEVLRGESGSLTKTAEVGERRRRSVICRLRDFEAQCEDLRGGENSNQKAGDAKYAAKRYTLPFYSFFF